MEATKDETESPEFFINQSTHTCLTVLSGTGASDAVIGMDKCNGKVKQQWFFINGKLQWGGNRSLCLGQDRKSKALCLQPSNAVTGTWNLDQDDRLAFGTLAMDVPWQKPRTKVGLFAKHAGINQKWWTLSHLQKCLQHDISTGELTNQCECRCQAKDLLIELAQDEEPKYLINQTTRSCLSVLSGKSPGDAVIELVPYTGDVKQQWYVKEGLWQWGGNRSYCLVPDGNCENLTLAGSNKVASVWVYDQEGFLTYGSHILDASTDGDKKKVTLLPKHGGISQKWWLHSNKNSCLAHNVYPFSSSDGKLYKQEVARGIINKLCPLSVALPHPRYVTNYPGTVAPTTVRTNLPCKLIIGTVRQPSNLRMTVPEDWQATNMYVVAGDLFKVTLPDTLPEKQAQQITIRVGAQCDCLDPASPNLRNSVFKRMPIISEEFELTPGINTLRSQYGGNLIFTYAGEQCFEVEAEIHNIVEAPHYILGKTSKSDWNNMKELAAPFAVLETNKAVLIVATKEAKRISDVESLLQRYNDIIGKLEDLSGFTENDPPPQGKQWLVNDVQITAGSAHAGFPAMFDRQFYDLTSPKTPHDWVAWHELGHNYQQGPFWSNAYGSETTVNLFSLFIEEKLKADDRLKREKKYVSTAEAVDKGLTFEKADFWQKLVFLMEIKHAFPNHGWDMYRHLNQTVRALSENEANILRNNLQKQYDHVYKTLSCFVGADLLPHYQRWGLPVSQQAQKDVSSLDLPKCPQDLSSRKP